MGAAFSGRQNPSRNSPVIHENSSRISSNQNQNLSQFQSVIVSLQGPDLAFRTIQSQTKPPEFKNTCKIRNAVNLRKKSLSLLQKRNPKSHYIRFNFDAAKPCYVQIYFIATESLDKNEKTWQFQTKSNLPLFPRKKFLAGLNQCFDQSSYDDLPLLDLSWNNDLFYDSNIFNQYPLVILLEVVEGEGEDICEDKESFIESRSQATYVTFNQNKESSSIDISVIKQKTQVNGERYELQEIYGMNENKNQDLTNKKEDSESLDCVICLSESRTITVLPCRHMCLCNSCASTFRMQSSTCPICRSNVESLLSF